MIGNNHDPSEIVFSLDRSTLAAGWCVWIIETGTGAWYNESPSADWLAFSHDGRELASSDAYGVRFWDPETGGVRDRLRGRIAVGYLPGDEQFVSLTPRRRVAIHNRTDGTEATFDGFDIARIPSVFGHEEFVEEEKDPVAYLRMATTGDPVRAVTRDGGYVLVQQVGWSLTRGFDLTSKDTFDLGRLADYWFPRLRSFSPSGRFIFYEASLFEDPRTRFVLRDIESDDQLTEIPRPDGLYRNGLFLPDEKRFAVVMHEDPTRFLAIIDLESPNETAPRVSLGEQHEPLEGSALAASADSNLLAIGSGSDVMLFETQTLREVDRLVGHNSAVRAVAFSPDGRRLPPPTRRAF